MTGSVASQQSSSNSVISSFLSRTPAILHFWMKYVMDFAVWNRFTSLSRRQVAILCLGMLFLFSLLRRRTWALAWSILERLRRR